MESSNHYDQNYFHWQSSVGDFGGWANLPKFQPLVSPNDTVIDFGCGGGYLLKRLMCAKKVGVEVNPSAAAVARENGVEVYEKIDDVPNDYVDVAISNNALEHTLQPLAELRELRTKIRPGGRIIFVVPCESISYSYTMGDINHHLYSWSPMCIGNLFSEAGFEVIESKPYIHKWPPFYRKIAKYGGRTLFELSCRIYGRLARTWFQVRIIGRIPN